ncbi:MAG: helix-turn-helix domain-containing protein [Rhizobiaceae bacterium]|nr:helix-turn-helix domain-containing protein [Rhizobiaceae bacterium]MBL4733658.1 helix-turn-helix domain-containing protein [Rhizobiaceae bacterium]
MTSNVDDLWNREFDWSLKQPIEFHRVATKFPVSEINLTKLKAGKFTVDARVIRGNDIFVLRNRQDTELSAGVNVLEKDYMALVTFLSAENGCRINGTTILPSAVYAMDEGGSVYICGGSRDTIGIGLRRSTFVAMIAALQGIDPEDIVVPTNDLGLLPPQRRQLQQRFRQILKQGGSGGTRTPRDIANDMLAAVVDAYLEAPFNLSRQTSRARSPEQIVRLAEERFLSSDTGVLSLADLCLASNVSKSTLYNAFSNICGEPPLSYFRKRRLSRTRSILYDADPLRGTIKRAALSNGFGELGRFSGEYRQLFGESPSATLGDSNGK